MTQYSIWLQPTATNVNALRDIVAHFSHLFNAEIFEPHMTIAGDIPNNPIVWDPSDSDSEEQRLLSIMAQIAEGVSPISAPINNVRQEDHFFRSFYIAFGLVDPLRVLKQKAADLLKLDDVSSFMPHVSLAYGVADSALKRQEIAKLNNSFDGLTMNFDRLALVTSSSTIPIKDWQVKHSIALA